MRDGRSAVVSHLHYMRDSWRDMTLAEVIEGKAGLSWSQHVRAWAPRPRTLWVRYENLAAGDAATLKKISAFIGKPQLHDFDISFETLHALNPAFFAAVRFRQYPGNGRRGAAPVRQNSAARRCAP